MHAHVARRWFGVGNRVPTKAIMAELGWTSKEWKVKMAKIKLWEKS